MSRSARWALGVAALVAIGCTPASQPEGSIGVQGQHAITGTVVRQLDASRVTLAHDAIKDLMPAMVMDIQGDALPALRAGDRIRATLVVTADTTRLTDVTIVTAASIRPPQSFGTSAAADVLVPDVVLRNQFGKSVRASDFRGQTLVVTFIYTRCPLPDFCPRLLRNFQELGRALATRPTLAPTVHMLAVSIDPEFDTPDVLRAYGEARLGGKQAFDRLDLATGTAADVARIATFFGLRYEPAAGQISHALVTGIIGPGGQLVKRFPEMTWSLDEAIAIVERQGL